MLILKQINKLKQNLIIGNILSYNIRRLCVHSLVVHQTLNCAAFAVFRLHCWFGFFLPFILAHFSKSDSAGVFMGPGSWRFHCVSKDEGQVEYVNSNLRRKSCFVLP